MNSKENSTAEPRVTIPDLIPFFENKDGVLAFTDELVNASHFLLSEIERISDIAKTERGQVLIAITPDNLGALKWLTNKVWNDSHSMRTAVDRLYDRVNEGVTQ